MRRFGQFATLKKGCIQEYKKLHAAVWPEVLATITDCNLRNYSIYLKGNKLFAYFEYIGDDFDADMERMASDPVTQEWWKQTKPCFSRHNEEIYYQDLEEIFHLD